MILMALAQFEREQTSERTRDAVVARTERGLWNGGRLFGFDLDPDRKGYLVPNEDEVAASSSSSRRTRRWALSRRRSSVSTPPVTARSRSRLVVVRRTEREFAFSTIHNMLKNAAYIGKREVVGSDGPLLVEAVWPAIVDERLFEQSRH